MYLVKYYFPENDFLSKYIVIGGERMAQKSELKNPARIRPIEVLIGGIFLLWLFAPTTAGDDNWFLTTYLLNFREDLFSFLRFRYETWSTRLILEAYTLFLLKHPILYSLSMGLWVAAVVTALQRLLGQKGNQKFLWAMCACVALIPIDINLRAGYVCTTVNYVFALACILWAAVPVVARLRGEAPPLWQELLGVLLMILGCNMEYYCPPALILFLVLTIKLCLRKNNPWLPIVLTLIAGISLWYALDAPTSTVVAYEDSTHYFPGYENLSILQKLRAAFVSTAGGLISTYCYGDEFFLGTLAFGVILALWGLEKEQGHLMYFLPGSIALVLGLVGRFAPEGSRLATVFFDSDGGWLWTDGWAFLAASLFFAVTLLCLWRADRRLCGALALALFCRVTMAASRSLFNSGLRTFYPLFYVYIAAIALLLHSLEKRRRLGWIIVLVLSGMMLSVNIYQLFL